MSYILVWKGKSACLVNKNRDPNHRGKYIEKYIGSMGSISKSEMAIRRDLLYANDDKDRRAFAEHNFFFVEVTKDIPRRKAPTGDIRKQPIKKEKKIRKTKKTEKQTEKKERIIWGERPWLKAGYLKVREQRERAEIKEEEKSKQRKMPSMTKAQKTERIHRIKRDIKFSKEVIAHKRNVRTFTKTEKASVQSDIDYHQSVVDSGNVAIKILRNKEVK